ncbi:18846_t:CDS:2, partial [Rhizophagus irregularis]
SHTMDFTVFPVKTKFMEYLEIFKINFQKKLKKNDILLTINLPLSFAPMAFDLV